MPIEPFERRSIQGYEALIEAFRARVDELQIKHETLERLSGLARGNVGKILGAAQKKRVGLEGAFDLIAALALRFELVPDEEARARMEHRYEACIMNKRVLKRAPPLGAEIVRRVASQTGKLALGRRKTFRISPQQVAEQRSNASKSRWKKYYARQRLERKAQRSALIEPHNGAAENAASA